MSICVCSFLNPLINVKVITFVHELIEQPSYIIFPLTFEICIRVWEVENDLFNQLNSN